VRRLRPGARWLQRPLRASVCYGSGPQVTLTARPASGSRFAGWSDSRCSGTGTCVVTMNSDQAVTATFTTVAAKPSCALVPQGAKIYVAAKHAKGKKTHKKHPPSGVLTLAIRCDQSAAVKLAGTITAVPKPKARSGKKHSKPRKFTIPTVRTTVTANKTRTATVKVPKPALAALEASTRESAQFTLTVKNANGASTTTTELSRLKLVRTRT
jgi:Divergent InlB B-repeat domain